MSTELKVTFQPSGRSVFVLSGTILIEAAARAGFVIQTPCGGAGTCGKCIVTIVSGACPPSKAGRELLGEARLAAGERLACSCRVIDRLVVEIPETSLFQTSQKILTANSGGPVHIRPSVESRYLELTPPSREDPRSDADRLAAALGDVQIELPALRALPVALREDAFRITATVVEDRVVHVRSGNHADACYGLAVDVGTTTLVATLVAMATGEDVGVASMINPQTSHGDDVVSRIAKCRDEAEGLAELQTVAMDALNELVATASRQAGICPADICEAAIAGNTTMQQILCGISPRALGEMPFVPAFRHALSMRADELGLKIHQAAVVNVFPQIGGFVGGDTVAGVLATRLDRSEEPALLVDVGTNGEIVLAHGGNLVATSVAAGPAFEGARITDGMRATRGAIEKVVLDGSVEINVIGNTRPIGICGTGLIDTVAFMLRTGVLDVTGRILSREEVPATTADPIRKRIVSENGESRFVLATAAESGTGSPVCLYQKDVRELQLANGAIRAGIHILLQHEGLRAEDLGSVLLAGAFGNFIRRRNARRIGMLPPIPTERIRFVGNTASFGAKRLLLSTDEKAYARRIARETRHIDLSLDPDFQMEFGAAMLFPEGEME